MAVSSESSQEVFPWLKSLPLAPEYHPTLAEFQDPIAYIFKIEKEASKYGICKIVPPVSQASKKTTIANLNRSLAARASGQDGGSGGSTGSKRMPTFTTRQQQIGFCPRKPRPVRKPVWQSGEDYTFHEFEAKAKSFEKSYLRKCSKKGQLSPLEVETLYWKATLDKPFPVEYANDMPGSAFVPVGSRKKEAGDAVTVGETAWNMRAVSRAEGSLLKFMKEEIPGVTSSMVYVAMMFSWFAWHVEDHDLHSLNYLHIGSGKTWYGVPRDAAVAFEEVVRVHGYGGEINPLVTFATLGEKTTVMSPEVFVSAGIPCCRLVQNAGDFVVTFPRAYHSGFSHGFNCGEAANIATPGWLLNAKDAAIRRASINYPPMVSHFQLLYDLALALCSRIPTSINIKPRSSRLKDKKKSEGEKLVKELFVQDVIHNNDLLYALGKGSSVVLLPRSSSDMSVCSDVRVGSQLRANQKMSYGLCTYKNAMKTDNIDSDNNMIGINGIKPLKGFFSVKGKFTSLCERNRNSSPSEDKSISNLTYHSPNADGEIGNTAQGGGLSDQRLFKCVTCGILSFACVALVQPQEAAARYIMSADCSFFNNWSGGSGTSTGLGVSGADARASEPISHITNTINGGGDNLYDVPVRSVNHPLDHQVQMVEKVNEMVLDKRTGDTSALGLLASNYGESSDSDDDNVASMRPNSSEDISEDRVMKSPHTSSYSPISYVTEQNKFGKVVVQEETRDAPFVPRSDKDSSRMHIFCLEHAVEVEQQLRPIGGAHIILLCHPEYPKIESEAKLVAEELGVEYHWNNIRFRDPFRDDEELIQSALESEEAKPVNSDWAVKLGINLFYSVNLSRSALYSKQMPYNSVLYNAFGRSSTGSSPKKVDAQGRRNTKQKKVVVGKWCGKVWMSNQVHPLLAQPDSEEQEQQERSVHGREMPEENTEWKAENISRVETTAVIRKYSRKRKMGIATGPSKKAKPVESDDVVSDDTSEDHSYKQQWRGASRRKQAAKFLEHDNVVSDDGFESTSHLKNRGILRGKQIKEIESDDEISDDSLGNNSSHLQNRRILASKQGLLFTDREDTESDVKEDYAVSDDSGDDCASSLQERHSKLMEMEDAVSSDSAEDYSVQHQRISKNKEKTRFIDREEMISYDSEEGNSHELTRRTSRRKKIIPSKIRDSVMFETLVNNTRRRPRTRMPKHIEKEDSEDITPDDEPHEQHTRSLRRSRQVQSETSFPHIRQGKRILKCDQITRSFDPFIEDDEPDGGPSTRLRKRNPKLSQESETKDKKQNGKKGKNNTLSISGQASLITDEDGEFQCDIEACGMSFSSKQELVLHKRNICPVKGCGKKFFSHKYLVQHRRVHMDDRPLKCPWKGCKMSFKWAWARTEHIRVHTGARPYVCAEPGCGQTFRFVSDFSRHKRKTGHSVKKSRR